MNQLGLTWIAVGKTGIIGILDTKKPGKNLGLRADMDALPVKESTDNLKQLKECYSKNDVAAHLCGHDAHMAILLGTMEVLVKVKKKLKGKIFFIFESGEETGVGIDEMIKELSLYHLDAIFGLHMATFLPWGKIAVDKGAVMAGGGIFELDVIGKSGHGSRPDLAINPLVGATAIFNQLSTVWINQISPIETAVLSITQIHGGNTNNIIPEKVFIGGSIRYLNPDIGPLALDLVKTVSKQIAEIHRCSVVFRRTTQLVSPAVVNDTKLVNLVQKVIKIHLPKQLINEQCWLASETFAHYQQLAPSVLVFCGAGDELTGKTAEHHNQHFEIDTRSLISGITATVFTAIEFLNVDALN